MEVEAHPNVNSGSKAVTNNLRVVDAAVISGRRICLPREVSMAIYGVVEKSAEGIVGSQT